MTRACVSAIALVLLVGCRSGEEPVRGASPGVPAVQREPSPQPPREPVEAPRPEAFAVEATEPTESEEGPERDLGEELKNAVGVPLDCLRDYQADRPTKVRASVSVTVRPTGMVITPAVYGGGLSSAARRCIEERLENVVLQPLEDGSSEQVATVIEMDYTPPVIVEAVPGVPEPRLRNVREPLPKRPEVAPSGRPIQTPTSKWISGGFDGGRPIQDPTARKVRGPKPRPIDGYEVDENAKEWR